MIPQFLHSGYFIQNSNNFPNPSRTYALPLLCWPNQAGVDIPEREALDFQFSKDLGFQGANVRQNLVVGIDHNQLLEHRLS